MAKRNFSSGLGRGLGALLGDAADQPEFEGVSTLPIEKVRPNQDQPRKQFDSQALADLTEEEEQAFAAGLAKVKRFFDGHA